MIDKRININSKITDRGIYLATIKATYQNYTVSEQAVFSRYDLERDLRKFFEKHPLSSFGLKEKSNVKQVFHISIDPITYLSDVNIDTYNRWKTSTENIKPNSIT